FLFSLRQQSSQNSGIGREEVHRGGKRRREAGLLTEAGSRRRAEGGAELEGWTLMADIQTKPNDASVEDFLNRIKDEGRRKDAFAVLKLMKSVTRKKPKMWGPAIVGFDTHNYKYASGREGVMPAISFSPRAQSTTLYV